MEDAVVYRVLQRLVTISIFICTVVFLVVLLHKLLQVIVYGLTRSRLPTPGSIPRSNIPHVTVQLPCYNEAAVIRRAIDAACSLDWPLDKLSVHVLDDSNDVTTSIAETAALSWRSKGVDCIVVRRPDRIGYKGGALQYDMDNDAKDSPFLAIFDADFAPDPQFLNQVLPYFYDGLSVELPHVGFVQCRWAYMNANLNLITRLQEVLLGAHFWIEQPFRSRSGRIWNANGTATVWRRTAIMDVGGWEYDTVVEDSDLSYRSWVEGGYRAVYLQDVEVASELPTTISDYRSQQVRWIKGFSQLFRKQSGRILRSRNVTFKQKLEFLYHALSPVSFLGTVWLHLTYPVGLIVYSHIPWSWIAVSLANLTIYFIYYVVVILAIFGAKKGLLNLWRLPCIVVLQSGFAVQFAGAWISGLFSNDATFVRTPKRGEVEKRRSSFVPEDQDVVIPGEATDVIDGDKRDKDHESIAVDYSRLSDPFNDKTEGGDYDLESLGGSSPNRTEDAAGDLGDGSGQVDEQNQGASWRTSKRQSSYFTTNISAVMFIELFLATWSLSAIVLAICVLANVQIGAALNDDTAWVVSVIVVCTVVFAGYLWTASSLWSSCWALIEGRRFKSSQDAHADY